MELYVVHTYSGQEAKVKAYIEDLIDRENLQGQIGQVLLPTQELVQVKGGRKIRQVRRDYPSYVIIEMEMTKHTMHRILDIPGVTHFIGIEKATGRKAGSMDSEKMPRPLRKAEADRILGKVSAERTEGPGQVLAIPYAVGDNVRINEGPFKDFDGVVEEVHPDKGKLKVMVSVFGRSTPVELDFRQVSEI